MSSFDDSELCTTPKTNCENSQPDVNKYLYKMLLPDIHYVEKLILLCKEVKERGYTSFQESCTKSCELVRQIKAQDTRFLILREFLKNEDECLPVPLLWAFEVENLLHFVAYLALKPDFVNELAQTLVFVLFSCLSMHEEVVISLLKPTFVSANMLDPVIGYPSYTFHSLFKEICISRIFNDDGNCKTDLISRLARENFIFPSFLLLFVKSLLKQLLIYKQDNDSLPSISDAISKQSSFWNFNKTPLGITDFIQQLLRCLSVDNIIKILHDTLTDDDERCNFRWYLVTISTLIVSNHSSRDIMRTTVDKWLKEAVSKKSKYYTASVILTVRQCYAESVPPFNSYALWFSTLSSLFDVSDELKFVINFLSEMLPYEPSLYLKIHINKVPSVSAGAYASLSNYILLAKTCLSDRQETTDYIGLFGEYKPNEKEGRESDITKVIDHFKKTGEVMKTVVEASVFRRDYYERIFLADLLQPIADENDPRYKFIEKLFIVGRCPNAMYNDWALRNKMEKMKQQQQNNMETLEIMDSEDWTQFLNTDF